MPVWTFPNKAAGFAWVPAVAPAPPNSDPPDVAGVATALPPPKGELVAFPLPNAGVDVDAPPNGELVVAPPPNAEVPVADPLPNRPLPAAVVGVAAAGFPKLNPPPVDVLPLAGCALPKRPPDAGAVDPKGEFDAPELLAAFPKLKPDILNVCGWRERRIDVGLCSNHRGGVQCFTATRSVFCLRRGCLALPG